MKKCATLAISAALLTAPAMADDGQCDISLNGDVSWQKGILTVITGDKQTMTITKAHSLSLDDKLVALDNNQQQWVSMYYSQIEAAVPMTLDITYDALELAGNAINEAFGELLGADNGLVTDLNDMFATLREEMDGHFYDENGEIRLNSEDFDDDGWVSERWENQYEEKVEHIVSESTGRLLIAIGKAMLSGDGDMDGFEQRMENWEEDFEQRVAAKSSVIEDRADQLCKVLKKADDAENKMQQYIPELKTLNMLKIDNHKEMLM